MGEEKYEQDEKKGTKMKRKKEKEKEKEKKTNQEKVGLIDK